MGGAHHTVDQMRTMVFLAISSVGLLLSLTRRHHQANAYTFNVVPDDKLPSADDSGEDELYNLMTALSLAEAGDTIELGDGTYKTLYDRLKTVVDGREGSPITIKGGRRAKIKAPSPSVRVEHSWITLRVRETEDDILFTSHPRDYVVGDIAD